MGIFKTLSLNGKKQTDRDQREQVELKASGPIPEHIAIIMDGNGRWAKTKGNMRIFGHKAGVDSVRDTTEACAQLGVKHLTLYAFSTENWYRPSTEVSALMNLLIQSLRNETKKLNDNDIRLTSIGQIDRLPKTCQGQLNEAIEITKDNTHMELTLALSYSGRWDITEAVKRIGELVKEGKLQPNDIDEELISQNLATKGEPDPDLMIRTSGEFRMSNFLLWQMAYSEIFITQTFWPDFRRNELYKAISTYQKRERRFGKISEQFDNGH
ncbi:MAG: isoprenyl transferase [Balneolales bacterium]